MSASVDSSCGREILYHTDGWTAVAGQAATVADEMKQAR